MANEPLITRRTSASGRIRQRVVKLFGEGTHLISGIPRRVGEREPSDMAGRQYVLALNVTMGVLLVSSPMSLWSVGEGGSWDALVGELR